MASTSSTCVNTKRDADSQVLSPILDKLDEESLKKLEPFITEIQEHIQQMIASVPQKKLRHRSREGMMAAAIYDTFLIFEQRSKVRVRSEFIAGCLGIHTSALNKNWRVLFDTRVKLNWQRIECVTGCNENLDELISEVVQSLHDALEEKTLELLSWFTKIEEEAKDILECLNKRRIIEYPPEIVAATAVYGAIQNKGKPMVQLSQRDLSFTCSCSPPMISKVWRKLFHTGSSGERV